MNINIGFPRPVLLGVDDGSTSQVTYEEIADSQHLPLFCLRTKKGPTEITFVNSAMFTTIFGDESLDKNKQYHNHQTEALLACFRSGNATVAIKRIVGNETKTGEVNLYLERRSGETEPAIYKVTGSHTTDDTTERESLVKIRANSVGSWSDEYGISIMKAPPNIQLVNQPKFNGFVYELRVFKTDKQTNRKSLVYSNFRDEAVLFTLNPDTPDARDNPYFLPTVIQEMYGFDDNPNLDLFGEVSVNLDLFTNLHNLLKSQDKTKEKHFWDYDVLSTGGLLLDPDIAHSLKGGDDGYGDDQKGYVTSRLSNLETWDDGVADYFNSMVDGHPIGDMAKNPISNFIDTGFSFKTKLTLRHLMGLRPDVWVGLSAFMVADHYIDIDGSTAFEYKTDVTQDEAINTATALRSAFLLYPESEVHGTQTMRAILTIQSGICLASGYKGRQSIIIDLLEKISRYMGAGNGIWKTQDAFDQSPQNNLEGWVGVNYTYRSKVLKETCWDAGIVWVENNGTRSLFYPAYQTIHPDDTSTLNNIFTMMGCCYLNKVVQRVWAQVTGNGRDPDALLTDKVNTLVEKAVVGKFDNRFKIDVLTELTPADKERGFSWTTSISLYSNVTPTVGVYKITTNRMS